jgi:predicted transcriptional regulator
MKAVNNHEKKSKIIQQANLNWNSLLRYLAFCERMGYIEKHDNTYSLTAKGLRALTDLELILSRIRELESFVENSELDAQLLKYAFPNTKQKNVLKQSEK